MTNATIETTTEATLNDTDDIITPEVMDLLENAEKYVQAWHAKHGTKTTPTADARDRFRAVLQDIDFETLTEVIGADYETTVRRLADQGYTAMSWHNYHRNYQADVSKEVDSLITMIHHMEANNKMPAAAAALWDYGTRLTYEPYGFVRRAGQMMALQALIETPKVCKGLAVRLQKELARYEPELWKVLGMEGPPT